MVKMQRIWITGFKAFELGLFGNKDPKKQVLLYALKRLMVQQIEDGLEWVITGGQLGIEQIAIEAAMTLKPDYPELKVAMMLPFTDFGAQWNSQNQQQLNLWRDQVDFVGYVSQEKYSNAGQLQSYQNFMLNHTDCGLIFFDEQATQSTARYAFQGMKQYSKTMSYPVTQIDFDRLQEYADEYAESLNDW
ncbi:DUF1273 domain-containing protein [Weissella diestrammenae]